MKIDFASVTILRFADASFPGWVEFSLVDAHGTQHLFQDKGPVVSAEWLDEESDYPRDGSLRCEVIETAPSPGGRVLVRIGLERHGVESIDGETAFEVWADQLSETDI